MMKRLVVIGGGDLKEKTTLQIDRFITSLVKSEEKRTYALFIPTASHDSKPYFNTFKKTYTSELGCKSDVAISLRGEMSIEHIAEKIQKADIIYVGGGDTAFMLQEWKKSGLDRLLIEAYERGTLICGLSAGAICWFEKAHSDYLLMQGLGDEYVMMDGVGLLSGACVPHYTDEKRKESFEKIKDGIDRAICIENDCAVYFEDGCIKFSIGSGHAYLYQKGEGMEIEKEQ